MQIVYGPTSSVRGIKLPLAELGDLGEKDEMKAAAFFDHAGVANHPGDLGMEQIAERIWTKLEALRI